ncbi:nitrite reductase (NADH) small subunit [Bacillus niacini]|jgi:nitrite reductase (NADH) small subunit|uniref:Nitrite reductase (NADH) small subunit n=2 Tax=Neobacillus TaxID=2675232 RepID=A0A852TP44_9BACI|nr:MULTISPECIES: nitrite reductase small subunit NirD [Neobacillus]MDP5195179.1 nitrite reductase small subunit NirD [Neobacillus sp. 179.-C4.2 HS]MDQ0974067.1 nitrite reductase (NADH) small subunit [Neobacillus niacini]NYE08858.1 nitrite reductase (NADH) small subunit [Neobacillus niacini]
MIETKTRTLVANYSDLQVRSGYSVKMNDEEVALFKVTNGKVYGIENRSPHPKGGVLTEGLVSGEYVFCPVYDWKISLVDGKVQAPDEGQVKTYQVEVEADNVYIII